jgi:undecaprenyl diphosphate synthase
MAKNNIPRHVGFIPDGNRRWATDHGLPKEAGYEHGYRPGVAAV